MKKALILMLALVIAIVPLSGCRETPDEYSIISVWEEDGNNQADGTDANTDGKGDSTGNSDGKGNSTGNSDGKGNGKVTISKDVSELKGKTYTLAVHNNAQFNTTSFNSLISAFESKYGCKIEKVSLDFNTYNQLVSQRMSTGDPYDILYIHGSFYPQGPISGLYEDLGPAIEALNPKSNIKDSTKLFDWKGKHYGLVTKKSLAPIVMYYNKVMFEEAGFEDPLTLYNQGKWTWDKIFEMGKEAVANGGAYFFGHYFSVWNMFGESAIYLDDNGKTVNNFGSENIRKALETVRSIYDGNNPLGMPKSEGNGFADYFPKGRCYMIVEETIKYADLAPAVKKSMAFNKNVDNLGIVPFPMDPANKEKAYPTGWYTAIGAGKGADPRVAVLWADFEANYNSPVTGAGDLKGAQKELKESLLNQKTVPVRHGFYATNAIDTNRIFAALLTNLRAGQEVSKLISDYTPQIEACMEATVGKGNYITK